MSRATLHALLMQRLQYASLEAISTDGMEREYVFFGKLENPDQLNQAAYYEDQEQWRIQVPCSEPNREIAVRIRKTVTVKKFGNGDPQTPSEPVYTLTVKSYIKGEAGTVEAENELPPSAGEPMLAIFRAEGDGMVKRRYFFPLQGEDAARFSDEDRPCWEVDAFWIPGRSLRMKNWQHHPDAVGFCLQPYVKLDLEVKSYDLKVHQDPKDGEYVRFDLPFPVDLNDVVYSQPHARTERDAQRVAEIMDKYMKAKA